MFGSVCFWIFSRFAIFNYLTAESIRIAMLLDESLSTQFFTDFFNPLISRFNRNINVRNMLLRIFGNMNIKRSILQNCKKQSRQLTSEKLKLYDDYKDGRMGRDLYKQRAEKISGQLDEIKRKIEDAEKTTTFINNKIWETDAWKTSIGARI